MNKIKIADGKYTVVLNDNGTIFEILRHSVAWPAANDLVHSSFILALVQEIEELREPTNEPA